MKTKKQIRSKMKHNSEIIKANEGSEYDLMAKRAKIENEALEWVLGDN